MSSVVAIPGPRRLEMSAAALPPLTIMILDWLGQADYAETASSPARAAGEPLLPRELVARLAAVLARALPFGGLVERLRTGTGVGAQPHPLHVLPEEPVHHRVVQPPADALALEVRIDEQRPDVAVRQVRDGEADDPAV